MAGYFLGREHLGWVGHLDSNDIFHLDVPLEVRMQWLGSMGYFTYLLMGYIGVITH